VSRAITAVRDLAVIVVLVVAVTFAIRFLGSRGGVSPAQTHTIDSLRTENVRLAAVADTAVAVATRQIDRVDDARAASRARARTDSIASQKTIDSLQALLPDTATVVPRPLHDAIVAEKDRQIATEHQRWFDTDAQLVATRDTLADVVPILVGLRRQNTALQGQVDDLERKANRRWSVCTAGGFGLQSTGGTIRAGTNGTIGLCYRLR